MPPPLSLRFGVFCTPKKAILALVVSGNSNVRVACFTAIGARNGGFFPNM